MSLKTRKLLQRSGRNQFGITEDDLTSVRAQFEKLRAPAEATAASETRNPAKKKKSAALKRKES